MFDIYRVLVVQRRTVPAELRQPLCTEMFHYPFVFKIL